MIGIQQANSNRCRPSYGIFTVKAIEGGYPVVRLQLHKGDPTETSKTIQQVIPMILITPCPEQPVL